MNPYGNKIHGQHRTAAYISWQNMKARSKRLGHPGHDPRWRTFEVFFEDMGIRPLGCELGRIDHNEPYSLDNCLWQDAGDNRREANARRWHPEL